MGDRTARAELDQPTATRPALAHLPAELSGDFPLGHARLEACEGRGDRDLGDRDGAPDQSELLLRLEDAQPREQGLAIHQLPVRQGSLQLAGDAVSGARLDRDAAGTRGPNGVGHQPVRVLVFGPAAHLVLLSHRAAHAIHLEGGCDDERLAPRGDGEGDQALAAPEVGAHQKLEVGGGLAEESGDTVIRHQVERPLQAPLVGRGGQGVDALLRFTSDSGASRKAGVDAPG